jgi:hypothetical protein
MRMILESCTRTTSFTSDELKLFRVYLNANIFNLDNNQRSIFLSLAAQVSIVCTVLRPTHVLYDIILNDQFCTQIINRLSEKANVHQDSNEIPDLFSWLARRCFENLSPGASFSRRCIVLKILEIMHNANVWHLETCDSEEKYSIFTHLGDSFDENRIIAKTLVQSTTFPAGFLVIQTDIVFIRVDFIVNMA